MYMSGIFKDVCEDTSKKKKPNQPTQNPTKKSTNQPTKNPQTTQQTKCGTDGTND